MKAWYCYQCTSYHTNKETSCGSQRSISYDSSLCLLWATGLAFPLDKTRNARDVEKKKDVVR